MRRISKCVVFVTITLLLSSLSIGIAQAKTFKNCTELNMIYPGGVALPGAVNSGGKTRFVPKFSKKLYLANRKSDRDKDGIACEK
jgi:hypothetical protein